MTFIDISNIMNRQDGALVIDVKPRVKFLAICNNPPLERERKEMSEALVRVRSLVKGLEPGKTAERAGLEAYAAKLAAVIHPIRSVPPEILSEIFTHFVAEPDNTCQSVKDDDFVDSLDTKSGVWALTHVCTRWRDIVTTASSLWTTVGLHLDKYPTSSATDDILATYLARSNQHDLNVIIHYEGEISAHPAMEVLITTCERWRGGWFALLFETFLVWDTPFPFKRLEKLRVCMPQLEVPLSIEDPKARCRAFSSALGLRDVAVDNHFIFRLLFDLDWSIVHRFCQEQRFSEDFLESCPGTDVLWSLLTLRDVSSVDMAQFDIEEVGEARWLLWRNMPLSMVRNAALSFLVLKGAPRGWQQMFSYLELPNMQTLHCHPSSTVELFPAPLSAVIGNGLHKLVVHVVANTNTDRIIAFLKMTPNLVQLTMTFDESFDIGPICAVIFSVTPDLVPRLTTLILTTIRGIKVVITKEFITALKTRVDGRSGVFPLKLRIESAEFTVADKVVQEELDSLLLGPDPSSIA